MRDVAPYKIQEVSMSLNIARWYTLCLCNNHFK